MDVTDRAAWTGAGSTAQLRAFVQLPGDEPMDVTNQSRWFGAGEHTVKIVGAVGDCEIAMDYIVNA